MGTVPACQADSGTAWPDGDYGYHCWIPYFGGFAARGHDGQMMYVFPDKDLIVVITARIPRKDGHATGVEDFLAYNCILAASR